MARSTSDPTAGTAVDLDRYTPAFFTFIANKLASGASAHYLATYGVGIETWRVLVMLAIEKKVTAQRVCQVIGMDKGSVSRTFKTMHAKGLISFSADAQDGRLRFASFTPAGRAMHDDIMRYALQREQAFLAVLQPAEIDTLIGLLRRLHENLPQVDIASAQFVAAEQQAKAGARPKTSRKPSKKVAQ